MDYSEVSADMELLRTMPRLLAGLQHADHPHTYLGRLGAGLEWTIRLLDDALKTHMVSLGLLADDIAQGISSRPHTSRGSTTTPLDRYSNTDLLALSTAEDMAAWKPTSGLQRNDTGMFNTRDHTRLQSESSSSETGVDATSALMSTSQQQQQQMQLASAMMDGFATAAAHQTTDPTAVVGSRRGAGTGADLYDDLAGWSMLSPLFDIGVSSTGSAQAVGLSAGVGPSGVGVGAGGGPGVGPGMQGGGMGMVRNGTLCAGVNDLW